MWKRAAAAVMLLVCGLAAGCGNTQTAGSQSRQGEQKVVVYMPSPTKLADQLAAGFTAKTGIKVEQFQGTTGRFWHVWKRKRVIPRPMSLFWLHGQTGCR